MRQRWLEASSEVRAELLGGASAEDALRLVAQRALELSVAEVVLILLADSDQPDQLTVRTGAGAQARWLIGSTIATGAPAVAIPLRSAAGVSGVLMAIRDKNAAPFAPEEVPVLTSFADQAALAMEVAETQRAQRLLELLDDRDRMPGTCMITSSSGCTPPG
ncbi:MAG TPA: GAF domain-containing protein [Pseudonocardiaceae bacterium]|nr:GAF domain-containing protein [Pseudonocardiaceae bacterium]